MSTFLQDARYAIRCLLRDRGFAATAILTLALGIGANTAIFSLLNPLVFRPLEVADPEPLARVFSGRTGGDRYGRLSYPNYIDARDGVQSFSALAAYSWPVPLGLGGDGVTGATSHTERLWGALVTGNYFSTLEVAAIVGRTFLPEEDAVPDRQPGRRDQQARLGDQVRIESQTSSAGP